MKVTALKTARITAGQIDLLQLLDQYVTELPENSVLAITSKIVSLCENSVMPIKGTDKGALIKQQSQRYLPGSLSKYGYHFTITNNTLAAAAGIDESNVQDEYVLWPKDSQATANKVREYLKKRFGLQNVGVIITDSTSTPLRLGTVGTVLAFSGFEALHDYVGQPDLFGRPFKVSRAGIASGLASTAVLVMGEGVEQTPLVVMKDLDFVTFQDHNPTAEELETLSIPLQDDVFAPFWEAVSWQRGDK